MQSKRSKDYYFNLFDSELSIAQAILDNKTSFWSDEVSPHLRLCAAILGVIYYDDKDSYSRFHHAKMRYEDLQALYVQKRKLWLEMEDRKDFYFDDLPF